MKSNALVFDLDDTLINTQKRHYQMVIDFLKLHSISADFSFEEYLNTRRERGFSNLKLLNYYYPTERIEKEFNAFWYENIESPFYLSLDEIIVDINLLENISLTNDLYILSLRSNHYNAMKQVQTFSFYSLFQNIIFLNHQQDNNPKTNELLKLKRQYQVIKFIGDSESDKEAAINGSVNFALVQTGIYKINNSSNFFNVNTYLKQFKS